MQLRDGADAASTSTIRDVATVARPWEINLIWQSAHGLATVATLLVKAVELLFLRFEQQFRLQHECAGDGDAVSG